MAIVREFDEKKGTVVFSYNGLRISPEIDTNDPKQLLDALSLVIENAYQKLRDAGIE